MVRYVDRFFLDQNIGYLIFDSKLNLIKKSANLDNIILNSNHPFYEKIYKDGIPKKVTQAVDALIFSLAFLAYFPAWVQFHR